MARMAVIDFGTNTFHLLICQIDGTRFEELYRKRAYIYLDRNKDHLISEEAYQKAIRVATEFKQTLLEHRITNIKGACTEVFRKKTNGLALYSELLYIIGGDIRLISGEEEAFLIFKGVSFSLPSEIKNYLIMDIGGGSTEFIAVLEGELFWKKSYKIGLSVLQQISKFNGYLSKKMISVLSEFLGESLVEILDVVERNNIETLVLNAGSAELLPIAVSSTMANGICHNLDIGSYKALYKALIGSTVSDREEITWLPAERIILFPLFLFLSNYFVCNLSIEKLMYSPASLKEGLLFNG